MKGTTHRIERIKKWMATAASIVIAATTTFASTATTTFASATDTGVVESADYKFSALKTASKKENRIKGDMDGDGCITASDASKILELYAYLSVGNEITWLDTYIPDVNSNGSIEASDASLVLAAYAAMSVGKPITWPPVSESDTTTTPPTTTTPAETTTEATTTTTTTKATTSTTTSTTTTTGETTSATTESLHIFKAGDTVRFIGDWWRVRSTMKLESDTNEVGRIYTNDIFKVIDLKPDYWYLIWVNSELYGYVRIIPEDAHNFQKSIIQETTTAQPTEITTTKATTTTTSTTTTTAETTSATTTTTNPYYTNVTLQDIISEMEMYERPDIMLVSESWWYYGNGSTAQQKTDPIGTIGKYEVIEILEKYNNVYKVRIRNKYERFVYISEESLIKCFKIVCYQTLLETDTTTTTTITTTPAETTTTSTTTTTGETTSATTTTTNPYYTNVTLQDIISEMEMYERPDIMLVSESWWYYGNGSTAQQKTDPIGTIGKYEVIEILEKYNNVYKVRIRNKYERFVYISEESLIKCFKIVLYNS